MIKIASIEETRRVEAAADANGLSYASMMEQAGTAAAQRALALIEGLDAPRITALIGQGNNGGDGLVAARVIAQQRPDALVRCYLLTRRDETDVNFKAVQDAGLLIAYSEDDHDNRVLRNMVASADLVLDAVFGIGARLPIKNDALKVLRGANQAIKDRRAFLPPETLIIPTQVVATPLAGLPRVLAIDCPSGLDCDTGALDANAIHADETVTFIAAKPGLLTFPGAAAVGRLSIAPLEMPVDLPELKALPHSLVDSVSVKNYLPSRALDSNKGSFGKALIVAGSVNYSGAAGLAAKAAYRSGAGLVTVGAPGPVISALAAGLLEATWMLLPHDMGVLAESAASMIYEQLEGYKALLLGPGWGQEETTGDLLKALLQKSEKMAARKNKRSMGFGLTKETDGAQDDKSLTLPPLVLDADALNLLAKIESWWSLLPPNSIITPHPGEMGRLAGIETSDVQSNRWQLVQQKAAEWNAIIVLKGAHTLIASPQGQVAALPFKTDALATAGTGDVLAGIIVGLLAQGMEPFEAAVCAGYVHGLAGEQAALRLGGGRGVMAGDVAEMVGLAFGLLS